MTTIMQPFQCDLQPQIPKHPITTHAQAHPKQLEATVTMRQKKANRPQPQPPHTGSTFHRRLQPLYTEKHKVSCSRFLPNTSPMQHSCSYYNAFRSITSQTCTYLRTWQHQMTTIMQPFQCDLQPQIPKHPIPTHAQAHPKQLEATVTMRQKKRQTDRSRNRRTQEVPFIAGCSHFTRKNARFCAPASSTKQSPLSIHAAITKSPLPKGTTSLTTSLPHHFPSSPLPSSLRQHSKTKPIEHPCSHYKVSTSQSHHFPSSPLPFLTTSLRHHFPKSRLPKVTTLPSSPLPLVSHRPSSRSILL